MLPARDEDQFGNPYRDPVAQIEDDVRDEYGPDEPEFGDDFEPATAPRWFAVVVLIVIAAMILSTIWWIAIV